MTEPMTTDRLNAIEMWLTHRHVEQMGAMSNDLIAAKELLAEVRRLRSQAAPAAGRPELCAGCESGGACQEGRHDARLGWIPATTTCREDRALWDAGHAAGAALLGKLERLLRERGEIDIVPWNGGVTLWASDSEPESSFSGPSLAAAIEAAPDPDSEKETSDAT